MAQKLDLPAPRSANGSSLVRVNRWLKNLGDGVVANEPIIELVGDEMIVYVHAPAEGSLSAIFAQPGQNILSGQNLGQLTVVATNEIEWDNFDQVTGILEDLADKSNNSNELRDANDALGQLMGVGDNPIFQNMSIGQQNKFLQNVVDQHQALGLSPADIAQKLLQGLQLRPQTYAPASPGPSFGLRGPAGPAPGGMGGGGVQYTGVTPQQQQGYAPYQPTQAPGQWPAVPQQLPNPGFPNKTPEENT